MRKGRVSIVGVLLFAGTTWLAGQGVTDVMHLSEKDGLSYRWVNDIIQDRYGFLWFATNGGLNRYDGTRFVTYLHSDSDINSISTDQVLHVAEDAQGGIWTYGWDLVFNRIDQASGRIIQTQAYLKDGVPYAAPSWNMRHFSALANGDFVVLFQNKDLSKCSFWKYLPEKNAFAHLIDVRAEAAPTNYFSERPDGKIWLLGLGIGYYLVDLENKHVEHFPVDSPVLKVPPEVQIPVDAERNLWYPADDPEGAGHLTAFRMPDSIVLEKIGQLRTDNQKNIWFQYSEDRLYRFDTKTRQLEVFTDPVFGSAMDYRAMQRLYVDQEGAYWFGHFQGAVRFASRGTLFDCFFDRYTPDGDPVATGFSARNIIQLDANRLLVRENRGRLFVLDLVSHAFEELERKPATLRRQIPTSVQSMILRRDGHLWTSQSHILVKTDLASHMYEWFEGPEPFRPGVGATIFEDAGEQLWWCGYEGIYIFDAATAGWHPMTLTHPMDSVNGDFTYASYYPESDVIYGTYPNGIYVVNCQTRTSSLLQIFADNEEDYIVTAVLRWQDAFWLSTNKGLVQFDPATGERVIYSRKDGLPSDIVYSALGSENELWLATHHGLCQFNPDRDQLTTYYREQGLPHNEFNRWSYLKTEEGHMYFGGLNGIIGFDPGAFSIPDTAMGRLNLVEYSKYNQKEDRHIRVPHTSYAPIEQVVVSPHESNVAFEYMISVFDDVEKNQYFHYMEGLERGWIEDGNQNNARYIQIPPGEYVFRVRAAGPSKIFAVNEIALPVIVLQYWYLRWWALVGYLVLAVIGIVLLYRHQLNRRLEIEKARKIREMEDMKTRMYTNITHEFRTPLTVMLGMSDAAKTYASEGETEKVLHAHTLIERNGQNLLNLVNQMLDLSKLEAGMLDLHQQQGDIVAYLKFCVESFRSYATERGIRMQFTSAEDEIIMDVDPDRVMHIVNNLLSNAIKFTPEDGEIYLDIAKVSRGKSAELLMKVRDTGIGIEEEQIGRIFDRFYQAGAKKGEGTGIGLALVREVIKLLGGSIQVSSVVNEGTEFTVVLPITNEAPYRHVIRPAHSAVYPSMSASLFADEEQLGNGQQDLPLVLIVEDNADVRHYIRVCLQEGYRTIIAKDGGAGIEQAIKHIPDVIISDVMMPVKDGYELCEAVKKDERTSHIPVILLTAKTDRDSRIEGLQQGADAYLAKPFDQEELLIRMKNMLALRAELQKRYAQSGVAAPKKGEPTIEDAFLLRIRTLILEHLQDDDFNVPQLCRLAHLSRAQLHRKLTALTGQSTSQMIRAIRLEKARELLSTGHLNISEIAYQVGFKTPAHFSRVFSETFGKPPSDYRR